MVNLKGIEAYNNVASLQGATMKIDTALNYTAHELKVKELLKERLLKAISKNEIYVVIQQHLAVSAVPPQILSDADCQRYC